MSFLQELKRRNVTKVAVLYVVAGWLILQAAELLFDAMNVSDELLRFVIAILVLGFPLVLIFSWVFELTPEGVKREKDIDRDASITPQTGQRINTVIVVLLLVAVAAVAIDRLVPEEAAEPVAVVEQEAVEESVVEEPVAAENSIGVLPFTDLSAEGDQEYFSDGIAEEILNVLVRIEGLQVASRTTSFGLKGQESLGMPVLAEKMKVRHVLEGSVRKAGDTVRITAQLIDAQSNMHLWSETYDRQLTAESLFAIQDEIAGAIVEQLGALMNVAPAAPNIVADTQNLEAYELYLQAHQLFLGRIRIDESIELFEAAVMADPGFARAWAALAAAYAVGKGWSQSEKDRDYTSLAVAAARKAIELNPELPLAYAVLAYEQTLRTPQGFDSAFENYDRALRLNPKEATVLLWRAATYVDLGFFDPATEDLERCLQIDPAYENCRRYLAIARLFAGDFDEASRRYEQGLLNGFMGNSEPFEFLLASEGEHLALMTASAYWYGPRGNEAWVEPYVKAIIDRSFEFEVVRAEIEATYKYAFGKDLVWSENHNIAFVFKNYAAITRSSGAYFLWFPYPEDFRQSPHRKRMIRDFGLFAYWQKHGFPPQCRAVGADDFECD